MSTVKLFLKKEKMPLFLSFFIPACLMALAYLSLHIYPGSQRSVLASDAFSQFSNFHAAYKNMLLGKQGFFYSWHASLGLHFFALMAYYLGGLFTPLVFFFKSIHIPDALYVLTLLKIGLSGTSFWFYARRFKFSSQSTLAFSTSYALMSFITAHSELVMWLDTFIYLPFIILGIERLQDQNKPLLLFVSYILLFVSNFYFGFMVAIFSFLYFTVRTLHSFKRYKKQIPLYLMTSLLATGVSLPVLLPVYYDLKTNGETFSTITSFKTEATSFFDLLIKNMIGVYDTTKYGSIPFIYVGLIPLVFCLFYFFSSKVKWTNKLSYFSLFVLLTASFYFTPFNLFWHGMHAPNMFLFRYSFLFSFLLLILALRGYAVFEKKDVPVLLTLFLALSLSFFVCLLFTHRHYSYITLPILVITALFLFYYLSIYGFSYLKGQGKYMVLLLSLGMLTETFINTQRMLLGISKDWHYASRSLYTEPYPALSSLVNQTKKQEKNAFYRLENIDPVSSNDSFNYGYSGISMFSSIRNRHSSNLLNQLGFRSRGTSLNIRYDNNTLLMDSLFGIRYNIAKGTINKFGFTPFQTKKEYTLYQNKYASQLGIYAPLSLNQLDLPKQDNLTSQQRLMNTLAQQHHNYFYFTTPRIIQTKNTTILNHSTSIQYKEKEPNKGKEITFKVTVPEHQQAYLSLFPTNFYELGSSYATVDVNGQKRKTQINITGQYYNLGYFKKATTLTFTVTFYGSKSVSFMPPKVLLLDTLAYKKAARAIQEKSVPFTLTKNGASATIKSKQKQMLFTSIPYDKGWRVTVNGKKIKPQAFKESLVMIPLPKGTYRLELSFIPYGFYFGCVVSSLSFLLFFCLLFTLHKQKKRLFP